MGGNMKGFLLLLSFMTRIPMPKIDYDEEKLGKSMKLFPLVGIVIGFILLFFSIVFSYILSNLSFSAFLPIIILVVILTDLISTGALHLDGLADTFDGIFSYRSKHKMLEIMKDSRLGSNGALALILYFLIKFVLLYSLLMEDQGETVFAVLTYPVVARLCSVISCASAPYARGSGMGKTFVDNTKASGVIIASLITVVYSSAMLYHITFPHALPSDLVIRKLGVNLLIIAILGLFAYAFSKLIERKIGGITGDTLGALLEISSLVYLFLIIVVPTFFL
ncbi:adenosylcobinamide-GDP ribazoletransferase [Fusobacterium periodonticum 1_1_41FAA]|uniref:Adenosylcobinamide-GDP ribazoletransferase n=2 Tax=Fusobacterium periodonticum TaxID=860 RepID=D6LJF9_9FUSO|nr:adenosylcobinamide-GDP ribazoletransferase [Fusobacterium periodonticum 1_1_41FAA]